jgi:hypothetical protein
MTPYTRDMRRAIYPARRASQRSQDTCDLFALYEARKQAWSQQHPGASSFEYQRAVEQITREVGV